MSDPVKLALWSGAVLVLLVLGTYAIFVFRKWVYGELDEEEYEEEGDSIYTTARLESMKSEGLIRGEEEYERVKKKVAEASRRRAEASKRRKRPGKTGLLR